MPQVSLKRDKGLMGVFRDLKFLADGAALKKIGRGEQETLNIGAGRHTFQVSMDWMRTNPIEVHVGDHDELHFECGTGLGLMRLSIHLKLLSHKRAR